ncbi:ABC transporter [Meiothermus sp. PNK-Is4]|nr:ABC transporter [Meiothermus sp. Pnk-1]RYM36921.1 ABC transporter [Meiothermus sp. PNK-Is4]
MRAWLELIRYPLQFLLGLVLLGLIFYLLFGFARLAGAVDASGYQTTKLIIGYLLGILAAAIISGPAQQVSREAKSGTLENMVLSGQGLTAFFVVQVLARSWLSLLQMGVLLVALAFIFKSTYVLSWLLLPAFLLFLLTALGLGLMLAALILLFKEVNQIFVLVQLLVFPAVIVEVPQLEWFPLTLGASLIREILTGVPVEPFRWALLTLGTVAVYSLGVFFFQSADVAARRRGLLGHE